MRQPDLDFGSININRRAALTLGLTAPVAAVVALRQRNAQGGGFSALQISEHQSSKGVAYGITTIHPNEFPGFGAQEAFKASPKDFKTTSRVRKALESLQRSAQGGGVVSETAEYYRPETYLDRIVVGSQGVPVFENLGRLPFVGRSVIADPINPERVAVLGDDGLVSTLGGKFPRKQFISYSNNSGISSKTTQYDEGFEALFFSFQSEDSRYGFGLSYNDGESFTYPLTYRAINMDNGSVKKIRRFDSRSQTTEIVSIPFKIGFGGIYNSYGINAVGSQVRVLIDPENGYLASERVGRNNGLEFFSPSFLLRLKGSNGHDQLVLRHTYNTPSNQFIDSLVISDSDGENLSFVAPGPISYRGELYGIGISQIISDDELRQFYTLRHIYASGGTQSNIDVVPYFGASSSAGRIVLPISGIPTDTYLYGLNLIGNGDNRYLLARSADKFYYLPARRDGIKKDDRWMPLEFKEQRYKTFVPTASR